MNTTILKIGFCTLSLLAAAGCSADLGEDSSSDSNDALQSSGGIALANDGLPQDVECDTTADAPLRPRDAAAILQNAGAPLVSLFKGAASTPKVYYTTPPDSPWLRQDVKAVGTDAGLLGSLTGGGAKMGSRAPFSAYLMANSNTPQIVLTDAVPASIQVDQNGNLQFTDSNPAYVIGPCALGTDGTFQCTMSLGTGQSWDVCHRDIQVGTTTDLNCYTSASSATDLLAVTGVVTKSCVSYAARGHSANTQLGAALVGGKVTATSR